MGLTAFVVFVVPWVVLAVYFTRTPTALRLGAAPAPWRPLPTHRELAQAQRQATHPNHGRNPDHGGILNRDGHGPVDLPRGGALGTSVEPTEPDDKVS
ncbi:hypothetical protein GGQ91_002756 [Methylobacterium fujisawaense]|uniref:Secreted protein n=1 Tax=Methylobacterium fujisawaense TaxID=107400 RepID=A0ABR6DB97_9HYPH|nr:hypothetical protein [Methylobacterium fujisawaense]MBA9063361.1 hypothetical protein [Methylobacterium fujisawaense]SFU30953.1 hypothetical protein SAMN02799643_00153 [Methylobacterium sp. UNCCL125]